MAIQSALQNLHDPHECEVSTWLERAERVRTQQRKDKNKLYALHAPEVECIGKGKARKPYEFGVKVSVSVTHKQGLLVGARSFTGNPYDGHILPAQMEQSTILLQDLKVAPKQVVVDLGFRGKEVDQANPDLEIIHRGRIKTMTKAQRHWLKRRQAVGARHWAPQVRQPHAALLAARCHGRRALHALCCAVGYPYMHIDAKLHIRTDLKGLEPSWYIGVTAMNKSTG